MRLAYRLIKQLPRKSALRPPSLSMAHFSTSGAQTAGMLLKTIPKEQQLVIARELTTDLRSTFDVAAASVAVELIADRDDATLRDDLLDVLKLQVEHGSPDKVVSLLSPFPKLLNQLLVVAGEHLDNPDTRIAAGSSEVAREAADAGEHNGLGGIETDDQDASNNIPLQWLRFAKIALSSGHSSGNEDSLFSSALKFLNDANRATALAARDLVFSLISSPAAQSNFEAVRSTITSLIVARDSKLQQTLGYALWMRLLAASDVVNVSSIDLSDDSYWEPLLQGLRNGDAERRKMCLDILKRSVALAVEQGKTGAVARTETGKSTKPWATSILYLNFYVYAIDWLISSKRLPKSSATSTAVTAPSMKHSFSQDIRTLSSNVNGT